MTVGEQSAQPGRHMAAEIAEGPAAFARAAGQDAGAAAEAIKGEGTCRAYYTIARGSSDAAALVIAYEMMRETSCPVTSLPPSVFSIGRGVSLPGSAALIVSQSGASDDLVRSARGAREGGAKVLALTNVPGSPVEAAADVTLPVGAGEELAVPATKTVVATIGAGLALISALVPGYAGRAAASARAIAGMATGHPAADDLRAALLRTPNVFVIGRDTGFGAAQELALKLKECCALHAEAYSASEVLHGPLQLVTRRLVVLMLDIESAETQESLDHAETRLREAGAEVHRIRPSDAGLTGLTPAAAAAALLLMTYPVVLATALALGQDPDAPATLSKVTQTT